MFQQLFNTFKLSYKTKTDADIFAESTRLCGLINSYHDYTTYMMFRKGAKNNHLANEQGYVFSYTLLSKVLSKTQDYPLFLRELVRIMLRCADEHEVQVYIDFFTSTVTEFNNSLVVVDELYKWVGDEQEQYNELLEFPLSFVCTNVPVNVYVLAVSKYFNNPIAAKLYGRYVSAIMSKY